MSMLELGLEALIETPEAYADAICPMDMMDAVVDYKTVEVALHQASMALENLKAVETRKSLYF